ncbi:NCS2 family permease [Paludifilum halophilum]|uniref:Permease n=1 Tax=Paludifilum halophilum TaxID=1642702 RepID=A0A235B571_9BACL|nr:NCS2 family permease [Paludifilum halophilum]OYD07444.1 permease [Paludifilum halophilum]
MFQWLNRRFQLQEHQTTWKREVTAGLTAFFTSAYILLVNPMILKDAGIPLSAGVMATIAISVFGCIWMAFGANAPIILIPGMGVNAFFSYTIVQGSGLSWQQALGAVTVSGVLFFLAAVSPLGNRLVTAVPPSLKHGITAGIGLFLTFIGLQKGELIQPSPTTFVALGDFGHPVVLSTLAGLMVTLFLFIRNTKGSLLFGILFTSLISASLIGITGEAALPDPRDYGQVFASAEFNLREIPFWIAAFSMTMIVLFENMGLLSGILPDPRKFNRAYKATAISTFASGLLGTSPAIASAESAAGIAEGGKTGIPALVTSMLFALSFAALPIIGMIPENAVAPVLIVIGGLMVKSVQEIPFSDFSEGFPAFLIIAGIPLTSSIVDGLAFGFITYPLLKAAAGQAKQVPPLVYGISVLFLLNWIVSTVTVH